MPATAGQRRIGGTFYEYLDGRSVVWELGQCGDGDGSDWDGEVCGRKMVELRVLVVGDVDEANAAPFQYEQTQNSNGSTLNAH